MTTQATTLALASVCSDAVTVPSGHPARHLPAGLSARLARAAHEAIARVAPANGRPAIMLDCRKGSFRLDPEESSFTCGLEVALERDVSVHRGREGARLVVRDASPAFLNGWPLQRDVPHLLVHGDVVRLGGELLAVRCDPPSRALVETGSVARTAPPTDVATGFHFSIEPSGQPLEVRCDATITRALTAIVLRHDHERPFDPTALDEVERATLDWLVHRIADRVAADVFASRISLRPAAMTTAPEVWASVALRIGGAHGAVWVGTTAAGEAAIAGVLRSATRLQLQSSPALRGIHVTLAARIDAGRIPASSVAAMSVGDILVAPGVAWLDERPWESRAHLVLTGSDLPPADAWLRLDGDGRMLAELSGMNIDEGGAPVLTAEEQGLAGTGEHPFGEALDAIGVVVAIEIARRRIRLSEALAISNGDVIELASPVSAKVSVLVDGTVLARGELVDVEGTLGVRILSIGGRR